MTTQTIKNHASSTELTDAQLDQVAGGIIGIDDAIVIGAGVVVGTMAVTAVVGALAWWISQW
ncbi:hypothetical protein JYT15_00970 [Acidimicrobium ferrooxidans]|nr:hypothetical protein [Acidimicrobium ferrooxidans]